MKTLLGLGRNRFKQLVLCLFLITMIIIGILAHYNLKLSNTPIDKAILDRAILEGMNYLDKTDLLACRVDAIPPTELWLCKQLTKYEPHAGVISDLDEGWNDLLISKFRYLSYMPDEPLLNLLEADHQFISETLTQSLEEDGIRKGTEWFRWFIYARYPEYIEFNPPDIQDILNDDITYSFGYTLTHQIFACWLFEHLNPAIAKDFQMSAWIDGALERLQYEIYFDFRRYDLFYERIAIFLLLKGQSTFEHRWIERIINAQNDDGGWHRSASGSLGTEFLRLFDKDLSFGESSFHPTFLALWALLQYRDKHFHTVDD